MKILVVVDMQNDFITGSLGTAEAVEIVPAVAEKIKTFDGALAVTQDTHGTGYPDTQEGRKLPVPHCCAGTAGWELDGSVREALEARAAAGTTVRAFPKGTFGSVELGEWLREQDAAAGVEEIVVVGLCTDICVISNALLIKAFLPEVPITVDAHCCAGVTPESHRNALAAMKMCQIAVENE